MFKEGLALLTALVSSSTTAWRALLLLLIVGHISWACGWLPGINGFALAGEVDTKVAQLDARLGAIETKQDIALRIALSDEICRLHSLREQNRDSPELWQTLNATFNARQQDYRAVNSGREYDVGQCSAPR